MRTPDRPVSARCYGRSESGFSLIETVVALGVLMAGLLGAAGVLTQGLHKVTSSPGDLVSTQKAAEAIESVFSARDSHRLTWAQLQNMYGASGADGGIFVDGDQPLKVAGIDGLLNTTDDGAVETVIEAGPDRLLGTYDDRTTVLSGFTRDIKIRDVETNLRSITVSIKYQAGTATRSYTLTTYISNYS